VLADYAFQSLHNPLYQQAVLLPLQVSSRVKQRPKPEPAFKQP